MNKVFIYMYHDYSTVKTSYGCMLKFNKALNSTKVLPVLR